ncbi:MAG: class D beta-lactamase [Xanthobacter sp.]
MIHRLQISGYLPLRPVWAFALGLSGLAMLLASAAHAQEGAPKMRVVCTLIMAEPAHKPVVEEGDCTGRMPPASTFKLALSLMGFDAGILTSPTTPEWPFREGYVDWREEWKKPANPTTWMRDSVVWYSQQLTQRLGDARFAAYVRGFDYGNMDVSGDPGKKNGLSRAWLSSSLRISPREQVGFLHRMLGDTLQVNTVAVKNTIAISDYGTRPGGWHIHGKTGAGFTRDARGQLEENRAFGWFVGWAERDGQRFTFARLVQDEARHEVPAGFRARDGLLEAYFGADSPLPREN